MEEDIKILEKIIEIYKDCFVEGYNAMCVDIRMNLRTFQAIQNLIARNKELEEGIKVFLNNTNISDIEPWSIYKINGEILFNLQELLEEGE